MLLGGETSADVGSRTIWRRWLMVWRLASGGGYGMLAAARGGVKARQQQKAW